MPDATLPTALRAVVFDVDGTLYRQGPVRRAMAGRLVRAYLPRPMEGLTTMRILSAYRRGQESLRDSSTSGDMAQAQLQYACQATGASPAQVLGAVARWMEQAPLDLLATHAQPGMQTLVRSLRARGIKLGVLSDYPAEAKLAAMGVGGLFDAVLCAQEPAVGAFKPNPRGILVALERLGVAPGEALYVGDRAEVDAAAARAAGVACAILSGQQTAPDPGYLAVVSFAELARRIEPLTAPFPTTRRAFTP